MRPIVAISIIALLTMWGVQQPNARFDGAWALGLLMLSAHVGGLVVRRLRLPPLLGWLLAGLLLGPSGAAAVEGGAGSYLVPLYVLVALWFGFQVGLGGDWQRALLQPRLLGVLGLSTLAAGLVVALSCVFLVGLPWSLGLVVGALSGLWGAFALSAMNKRGVWVGFGLVGNAFALTILTVVLSVLIWRQELDKAVLTELGQIWLSLLLGGVVGEIFARFRGLKRVPPVGLALLCGGGASALLVYYLGLYPLVFGVAAGVVLSRWPYQKDESLTQVQNTRPLVAMIFFALMGARLDLAPLLVPQAGLYPILLVQLLVMLGLRGVGPLLWLPLADGDGKVDKKGGLFLLAKGVLLFELAGHFHGGLLFSLENSWALLLRQVVLADIILYLSVFALLATVLQKPLGRLLKSPAP